jgi:RNA polymerase sigma factor (sigma-70 family)
MGKVDERRSGARISAASVEDRFCQLLELHGRIVIKVANTYAFDQEDRRDLTQCIKLQLWKAFPSYDESKTFSTWMYRIALNVAVSHVRSEQLRKRTSSPIEVAKIYSLVDPSSEDRSDPRIKFLDRFLESLGPPDRALFMLYLEDQNYQQISEILGTSETNVATKLSRLKQLARAKAATEK